MDWKGGEQAFLNYLHTEKRYSPHTIKAYGSDLAEWAEFLGTGDGTALSTWTLKDLKPFIAHQAEKGIGGRSIARKIAALRRFFRFALVEGWITENPATHLKPPKAPKKLPEFIRPAAMEAYFEAQQVSGTFSQMRNNFIVLLLYGCGIRRAELIGLTPGDFDASRDVVKVVGKRQKVRLIPVLPVIWEVFRHYVEELKVLGLGNPHEPLIVTDTLRPAYPGFIHRVVTQELGKITTQQKRSPHILRHTFATHLLNAGADINAIKEMLGHSSLAATQVYTHNSFEQLKQIHRQAHPKG